MDILSMAFADARGMARKRNQFGACVCASPTFD
jgi:hypothetical protein